MGTRANIIVRVENEDVGKIICPEPDQSGRPWPKTHIEKRYLKIYVHHDGYIFGGTGETLYNSYNSYSSALDLVLHGNCSTVLSDKIDDYFSDGENWSTSAPKQLDEIPEPKITIDYSYIWNLGRWWVREHSSNTWLDLEKVVLKGR